MPSHRAARDLAPGAERWLVWHGFINRLPTTIFYASSIYGVCFVTLTVLLVLADAEPTGAWRPLYCLGLAAYVPAMFLSLAGWISRSQAPPSPKRGRAS